MKLQDGNKVKVKDLKKSCAIFGLNSLMALTSTEKSGFCLTQTTSSSSRSSPKDPPSPSRSCATPPTRTLASPSDLHQLLPRAKKLCALNLGSPLVVLNGFNSKEAPTVKAAQKTVEFPTGEQERQIMATMFNNLFPNLNLSAVKTSNMKRMVLINFDAAKDVVELRHYFIKQNLTDMNNKLKKMINNKKIPNLSDCKDLSQYFAGDVGYVSESDIDHLPNSKINLEEETTNGKTQKKRVNLRLFEIGPRLTLKLVKIEEAFLAGAVFYHRYTKKTHKEKKEQKNLIQEKQKLREERKRAQEENVKLKEERAKEMEELLKARNKPEMEDEDAADGEEEAAEEVEEEQMLGKRKVVQKKSKQPAAEDQDDDSMGHEDIDYDDGSEQEDQDAEHLSEVGDDGQSFDEELEDDSVEVGEEDIEKFETDFV